MKNNIVFTKKIFNCFAILFCLSLISCEDVIEVDLDTGEDKVVIDAEILWQKGTDGALQTINISRMAAYYNPNPPKVSGAQVYIENTDGIVFTFNETDEQGTYVCTNFIPELHKTYTLYVETDGQVYTATETMIPVSEINRIEQEQNGGFTGDEMEVAVFFNDPVGEPNYYLTSFTTDILPYPDYELTEDELYDGNEIKNDFSEDKLKQGTSLEITLRGISQQFHNYMNLILEATDSSPFSTPPANIKGNILNQNNTGSEALGYFRLCESDTRYYVVQ
ncbi:DUF4249 domain-containing protein [Flavobacterium salilacus subsp. salilacus]|uniref:DUF4249 domain-containing protein n=1 Tax=Flavobacterium TaxID=237 RepID=UPI00107557E9|nr:MULTISPECIES: DUF4249 domain-containing protein [Flavobacterium]KAF2515442.1 DUF4249 domain-containing protein [Flavobacterium salilacus subsp. salilacus]MBE1615837.1 DUF4249 domain-containing protein [Flavobacterium sp. SaA2.13]NDJ00037.1 DUF4249 domain-containing protein [Flavobacterium salilacus subsp. altitudinum]